MNSFNLSDWALATPFARLVFHDRLHGGRPLRIPAARAGGRSRFHHQDHGDRRPQWPGASPEEITRQVTDRIEKKLEELESLDYTKSVTVAGQTTVFVYLRDTTKAADVAPTWARVRNMIADIKGDFPQGVIGPGFNDRFGDVFGNIYAFTSDGLTQRQLRDQVEDIRAKVLTVPNVGKVDILGAQDEMIYLEFSTRKIAALGLDTRSIIASLQAQNAVTPSGVFQEGPERISVRVNGQFASEESLKAINLRVNDRFFPLTDVATITRGYADPPTTLFRFNGQPAIALAIGMKTGANFLQVRRGAEGANVEDPGRACRSASGFISSPISRSSSSTPCRASRRRCSKRWSSCSVISFLSLGLRAGLVVAIAIPLVLAITFVVMAYTGISLQRISLGALIIALGLLVDDAMIAVEMMVARLEVGDPLEKAATHVYTSTAFPMLTGTLVTVAGFIPIGLNSSNAGEFTFTLFVVIAVSLLVSWIVAVLFTPLLGVTILPAKIEGHHESKGRVGQAVRPPPSGLHASSLDHHRGDGRGLRARSVRHELRAAAVLPVVGPCRTGHRLEPAAERLDHRDQCADRPLRARTAAGQSRRRPLVDLCGNRRSAICAVVRRADGEHLVRPDGRRHQGRHCRARSRQGAIRNLSEEDVSRHGYLRQTARGRPAGRASRAVSAERARHRQGQRILAEPRRHRARQSASRSCRVRLDGACARRQGRCPAGQGAPAWRELRRTSRRR